MAGEPQELARRALITATCGLGLIDAASVGESFHVARATGKLIRRLAGVENCETPFFTKHVR
jgi:hypothetical protein